MGNVTAQAHGKVNAQSQRNTGENGSAPPGENAISLVQNKDNLKALLDTENFRESMRAVATKYMTADRVVKVALLAASRQPKLFLCTAQSFLQAVIKGAELGLEFGGTTQQGFLVPYKNGYLSKQARRDVYECQFIPGYRGFIELGYRSGNVSFLDVQLVYEKDKFDYGFDYGLGKSPFVQHKPQLSGDRGALVCGYSVIILKDSALPKIDFMTAEELEKVHQSSKSKDDGPWVTWPDQMQKKSVIRRSIKWIRTTPELAAAEELDNADFDLSGVNVIPSDRQLGIAGCKSRLMNQDPESQIVDAPPSDAAEGIPAGEDPFAGHRAPESDKAPLSMPAGLWSCDNGHKFDAPKRAEGSLYGACPTCNSTNIQCAA